MAVPITFVPASPLPFDEKTAGTKGFEIRGGNGRYEVSPLDELPEGISYTFRGGDSDTVSVKVTAAAPAGEYRLRVQDTSNPRRSEQMVLRVGPKSGGTAISPSNSNTPTTNTPTTVGTGSTPGSPSTSGGGTSTTATAVEQAWSALIGSINGAGFERTLKDVTFTAKAQRKNGKLAVTLSCKPAAPATKLVASDVRDILVRANAPAALTLRNANVLDKDNSQIDLSPSATCVQL